MSTPVPAHPVAHPRPLAHASGEGTATTPTRTRHGGQATAEYALVLLGAAAIALLLAAWAAQSGQISALFDAVVGQLIDKAG